MSTSSRPDPAVALRFVRTAESRPAPVVVNDVHSRLNATTVRRVVPVRSDADVANAVRAAASDGLPVGVGGGRHAMGGQQFATGGVLLDTRSMAGVRSFDADRGLVEVDAGIQWPALVEWLLAAQGGRDRQWGIRQKQTGADRLSVGGAVAANAHGRGLSMRPFVSDVEALTIVGADGVLRRASRDENPELFSLACGGYGLFGVVTSVTLRLSPRRKLRRVVEIETVERLAARFEERIRDGYLYGDFQFALDPRSDDFLRRGILSCYEPVDDAAPIPADQHRLSTSDWERLLHLAHTDKQRAWELYAGHYLASDGQVYWTDTHQLTTYVDDYHRALDDRMCAEHPASEIISELYVPRERLADFMADVADDFRRDGTDCVYGTIRMIERDDESFLPWARGRWACVIFNLHTEHTTSGIARSADAFRALIDRASEWGGSYYLTYHRFATEEQVERCHPRVREFLRAKRAIDPEELFRSDWYRHTAALLGT